VSGPLAIIYQGQSVSDQFDKVQHLTALQTNKASEKTLQAVIRKRGGDLLLGPKQISQLCEWSGGVLRDLISLARDAAEEAYLNGNNSIGDQEIEAASTQLGTSYLRGLSPSEQQRLRRLKKTRSFDTSDALDIKLLATRRIIEYSATNFRVHPALWKVLPQPGESDA
jgi:hypothetical protein